MLIPNLIDYIKTTKEIVMKKLVLLLVLFIPGCSLLMAKAIMNTSGEATLQRESALSIGKGTLLPEQVKVSNIDRGAYNVTWVASTPKGKFSCSSDDMVRRVNCVR
jgi:hypothetical protein